MYAFSICCCQTTDGMPLVSLTCCRNFIIGGSEMTYCRTDILSCIWSRGEISFLIQAFWKLIGLKLMFQYYWTFWVFCLHWNHHWFHRFLCSSWVVGVLQHPANTVLWGDSFSHIYHMVGTVDVVVFCHSYPPSSFLFQFGAALILVACVFAIRALCVLFGVYAIGQQIGIAGRC